MTKATKKSQKSTKKSEHSTNLSKKQRELHQKIISLTDSLQRTQAEFENYKKRTEITNQENIKYASKEIILTLLPILDNFELAIKHTSDSKEFIKGIELVYSQFLDVLESQGLKQIKSKDEQFDPAKHEALMQEYSKKQKGIILEEFQKGYSLNDKVIRQTKVKVSKGDKNVL